jgi:hypothetical protein
MTGVDSNTLSQQLPNHRSLWTYLPDILDNKGILSCFKTRLCGACQKHRIAVQESMMVVSKECLLCLETSSNTIKVVSIN